jgi:hypothetical protein
LFRGRFIAVAAKPVSPEDETPLIWMEGGYASSLWKTTTVQHDILSAARRKAPYRIARDGETGLALALEGIRRPLR